MTKKIENLETIDDLPTLENAPLIRKGCIFRVLDGFIALPAGDYAGPGDIVDMSDCADASIRWHLEAGLIETADGKPVNTLTGIRSEDRPCPCNK